MIDRLEIARMLSENAGLVQQFAIDSALELLRRGEVVDPGMPEIVAASPSGQGINETQLNDLDTIKATVAEYQRSPLAPELVNTTWKRLWYFWGKRVDHIFNVPECDRTKSELDKLSESGRAVLLVPDEVYTPEGAERLGEIFPGASSRFLLFSVEDPKGKGGCLDVEFQAAAPNTTPFALSRREAEHKLIGQNSRIQRLPTYVVGSEFLFLLEGSRFDQGRFWSRIASGLLAGYDGKGRLDILFDNLPDRRSDITGARTEGFKK